MLLQSRGCVVVEPDAKGQADSHGELDVCSQRERGREGIGACSLFINLTSLCFFKILLADYRYDQKGVNNVLHILPRMHGITDFITACNIKYTYASNNGSSVYF